MRLEPGGRQHQHPRVAGPDGAKLQQCLVLYDLCLLNGQVVTGRSYRERRRLLEAEAPGTSAAHVVTELNVAIDRREEGLLVKDHDAVYKPVGRAGAGWVKVKPEYEAHWRSWWTRWT